MSSLPLTALSADEQLLRESVRDWAERRLRPLVRSMDADAHLDTQLLHEFFDLGWMSIQVPPESGGGGGNFFDAVLVVEELSRVDAAIGVVVDVQNTLINNALLRWGSEQQKREYLPRLASGWLGAYALSESGSGSDAFAMQSRAERGPGGFRLHGRKQWITNAQEAQFFIVFANAEPGAGYRGITGFLVQRDQPGFSVGRKEDKLGIRASSTCELILDGCEVSDANVLGEVGKGYKIAIETLNEGRIGIAAQMLGLAQGALECATAYAQERQQFGGPIVQFQAVQFELARMHLEVEAARLLVYNAARLKDAGAPFIKEAAMAKLFASQAAEHTASRAVEIYGGNGFVKDYPVEKYYRDAKIGSIYEGTSNLQLQTIARLILKS